MRIKHVDLYNGQPYKFNLDELMGFMELKFSERFIFLMKMHNNIGSIMYIN